jgi:hypothetical protein
MGRVRTGRYQQNLDTSLKKEIIDLETVWSPVKRTAFMSFAQPKSR